MSRTDPPHRASLGDEAYGRLRDAIVTCRLTPGQSVYERKLALELGLSLAPVRHALTRLAQDGLVHSIPRSGYRVAPLTAGLVRDAMDAWLIIGPEIARLGVERATPDQLQRIAEAFDQMTMAAARGGASQAIGPIVRAFETLVAATDNVFLRATFDRLAADLTRIWLTLFSSDPTVLPELATEAWWEHLTTEPDPDSAATATRRATVLARGRMLEIVNRWPSVEQASLAPVAST